MHDSATTAARVLMGDSLGFHIIFVLFSLTLPVLVSWFEYMGIRRKDKRLIDIAHFWSKIMAVLVITGVISGTVIALQMSLVWPGILKFGGEVIGLPFMFETYAFIIEAVFLGLYMKTWNSKRVGQWLHWLYGLGVAVGSTLSAYAITSINGWMNLPTGFTIVSGKFENISVVKAMFSQTALIEFFHSMAGYYIAASLTIAGLYCIKLARAKSKERNGTAHKLDWFIIQKLLIFASIAFVVTAITADLTGKYLAKHEPEKLAAIELIYETTDHAPLIIGGVAGPNNTIKGPYFKIPSALSILSGNSPNTVVKGLNEVAEDKRPPLYIHTLYDIKMTLMDVMVAAVLAYFVARKWRPKLLKKRISLIALSVAFFFGLILVELGWMLTEIGRQPWAVRGYLTTAEAVTKTHDITSFGFIFPAAYVVLFAVTILAVRRIVRDETKGAKV